MLSKKFNEAGISFTSGANRDMDYEEDEEEDGGGRGGRYTKKNIRKLKCPRELFHCFKVFIPLCEQVPQHAAEERAEAEPDVRDRAAGHAAEGGAAEAEEGRHLHRRREGGRRR